MSWGKSSDQGEHRARGQALTAAYRGPSGLPFAGMPRGNSGAELRRRVEAGGGSRGGAPIWVMREAWMSADEMGALRRLSRDTKLQNNGAQRDDVESMRDPDGFAVFGRYPKGFLDHVIKSHLLGRVGRDDILHVCSGTLGPDEKWTVDLRLEARPLIQASGTALPFRDGTFKAVMLDPPYSDEYARNLYKVENPRPSWLLKEAARVCQPGGRIGILHVAIPFSPPDAFLVNVYGISTGVGFRIRAFTVYERRQQELAL